MTVFQEKLLTRTNGDEPGVYDVFKVQEASTLRTELYTHATERVTMRAPVHWGLGEIDGLLMPPGKASNLLTDHLITG